MGKCLNISLQMQEQTDIISCVLLLHMIKNNLHMNTNKAVLEIGQYLRTQQQKHFIDIWLKLFDHTFEVRVKPLTQL